MKQEYIDEYCSRMEEIKLRTEAIYAILQKRFSTPYPATNVEFMCLQIRKILELIALGSLITDKDEYLKHNNKLAHQWRTKYILKAIEAINPKFYPVPTKQVTDPITGKVKETIKITEGYLTQTEFPDVYDKCSDVLHSGNLLRGPIDYEALEKDIPIWISKIVILLNHHQIQLYNENRQLWVGMKGKIHGRVFYGLMERIDK